MGLVATNPTVLRALTRGLRALFNEEIGNDDELMAVAMMFMMNMNSTGAIEDYNWLGENPSMEEWIDERPMSALLQKGISIKNSNFANGFRCPLDLIEDDQLGQIQPRVLGLAEKYKKHVFNSFVSLIENGTTELAYDGQAFFSATHAEGTSGTQSNLGGTALSATNFETAYANMTELKDDRGELLGVRPTHLWTSSTQRGTANEIVKVDRLASGASNPNKDLVDVIIIPGLTTQTNWGLLDNRGVTRPFIKQDRRKVAFSAMDKMDDEQIFNVREVRYGADYRGGYGYGIWQKMYFDVGA